jgi:DNA polymerase III subunit epsilon
MVQEHRNPRDRNAAINWAKSILEQRQDYVILDTETTGLGKNDVIVQIGIIDLDGNVLLDSMVKPTKRKRISDEATAIHKISMKDLIDKPIFDDIIPKIRTFTTGKRVLIFNSEYDERLILQTINQDEATYFQLSTACVMLMYSKFVGQWNNYHFDYVYQPLPLGDHSAIGDCKATLNLILNMAQSELSEEKPIPPDSPKPKNMMEIMKEIREREAAKNNITPD